MNKYITMLVLGVVVAAMILVWSIHNRQLANEEGKESLVAAIDSQGNEVSGQAGEPASPAGPRIPVRQPQRPPQAATQAQAPVQPPAGQPAPQQTPSADAITSSRLATATQTAEQTQARQQPRQQPRQAADASLSTPPPVASGSYTAPPSDNRPQASVSTQSLDQTPPVQTQQQAQLAQQQPQPQTPPARTPQRDEPPQTQPQTPPAVQAQPRDPRLASKTEGQGAMRGMAFHFRGNGMVLAIEGDSALPARYFLLNEPERLVIDLPGAWKNIKVPAMPANQVVKSARYGRQAKADRLVLDLSRALKKHELIRVADNKVEIFFE